MKRVIVVLVCISGIMLIAFIAFGIPYKGEVVETWESSNTPFKVRINKHIERGSFVPLLNGAYYDFQAMPAGSDSWREIMTFRYDGFIDIPKDNVSFADENVASVFMSWRYAVTTDGGSTWQVSSLKELLPTDQSDGCRFNCIDSLQINPDGGGQIVLRIIGQPEDQLTVLKTNDFARSWK